jgi:hypothetical protein
MESSYILRMLYEYKSKGVQTKISIHTCSGETSFKTFIYFRMYCEDLNLRMMKVTSVSMSVMKGKIAVPVRNRKIIL